MNNYELIELTEYEKEIEEILKKINFLFSEKDSYISYNTYYCNRNELTEIVNKTINNNIEKRRNIKKSLNLLIKKSKQLKKKLKNIY